MRASSRPRSEASVKVTSQPPSKKSHDYLHGYNNRARTPTASSSPLPHPQGRPAPSQGASAPFMATQQVHHQKVNEDAALSHGTQRGSETPPPILQQRYDMSPDDSIEYAASRYERRQPATGDPRQRIPTAAQQANTRLAGTPPPISSCLLSDAEVKELLDENEKLRTIEKEFWILLHERENFQDEIKKLKATQKAPLSQSTDEVTPQLTIQSTVDDILRRHTAPTSASDKPTGDRFETSNATLASETAMALAAAKTQVGQFQLENESLKTALHECMDLMISEELRNSPTNTVKRDGPVAAFLGWLKAKHDRGEVASVLATTRHELNAYNNSSVNDHLGLNTSLRAAPSAATLNPTAAPTPSDRIMLKSLTAELHNAHAQLRALQQELDRTDLSRRQALDDCDHMRQQVEELGVQLQQATTAYRNAQRQLLQKQVHEQTITHVSGVSSTSNAAHDSQLARRNAEIHQARANLAKAQREREIETFALAEDTERIRREMARRSVSNPRTDEITVTIDEI